MKHRIRSLALAALLPLALAQLATAQAPTPGERWRTTMSMEAMGMKMPGMTQEVCAPKAAANEPPPANPDCTQSNLRRRGNTVIVDMACKDGTTGTMEMTQESPTKWSSKMLANTKEGQMTMLMNSEKLPGECDASEMQRKVNKMMAEGDAAKAKQCGEAARSGQAQLFIGSPAACTDKASVDAYCGFAKTMKGYNSISRTQRLANSGQVRMAAETRTAVASTGKLCGFAPETVRKQHCSAAQGKKEWTFFAEECPEIANPLGQRECVGRDFTTPVAPAYQDFCSAWSAAQRGIGGSAGAASADEGAGEGSASGKGSAESGSAGSHSGGGTSNDGNQPKPTDAAKEALKKGKDALKGLFGR